MGLTVPPAWIRWLGWSKRSDRVAWRAGPPGTANRKGTPFWVMRVDGAGVGSERRRIERRPGATLRELGIRRRGELFRERVTPRDILLGTRDGRRIAVVLRKDPAVVALVRRRGERYEVLARAAISRPARYIRAVAYLAPNRSLVAIIVHSGLGETSLATQATLWVLPLD